MKKLGIIIIAFISLTMVSCNKDYSAANDLEGSWNFLKTINKDGSIQTNDIGKYVWIFSDVSKGGGDFTVISTLGSVSKTEKGTFQITEDGEKITLIDPNGSSNIFTFKINKEEFIIYSDGYEFHFSKK